MDRERARDKKAEVIQRIQGLGDLLVAFSGGVDSTFLLALAQEALGDKAMAATSASVLQPAREREGAVDFAGKRGIRHVLFYPAEMTLPEVVRNGPDRCYHCKKALFRHLFRIAREKGFTRVAHGANADDLADYRPGFRAAEEAGVVAPLVDGGLHKEEIRFLSREMGLPTWDKPAMACLASRIPYHSPLTEEKLRMIDEAETFILGQGVTQVRVRHHGSVARVEVGDSDVERLATGDCRRAIVEGLRRIGFDHVALDLEGYVTGSMNRELTRS